MSTGEEFDCVVVGAGIQGSFTALELARRNQRTLLLEQVWNTPSFYTLYFHTLTCKC